MTAMKWEYEIVLLNDDSIADHVAMLDRLGADGWKVVAPYKTTYRSGLILSRPASEDPR